MAGSLIEIQKTTLGSATAAAVLTGIDSTYNVYKLIVSNMQPVTDNKNMIFHITKSGSADTTSNYDHAARILQNNTSFSNTGGNNGSSATFAFSLGNGTNEKANAVLYLYNFADTSEYSFVVVESIFQDLTPNLLSYTGGIVHTVASASDGVSFTMESGVNINAGAEFTLYGLKK